MNILLIGGNGFIGSHLVDHLLMQGHRIRVFDITYERYREPIPTVDYRISTLENIPDLYEALLGIEIIFYLASSSVPSTSNVDTVTDINKNLIPLLNVLNLSIKLGIKRIIYFSSGGAVYGDTLNTPITEEQRLNPISSYGIVKVTVEMYLFLYQKLYDLKPLILRPSNPYGPRQGHFMAQGVISTFLRKVKNKENITVFGDGNSIKDYIFITDLIDMCSELSFSNEIGAFNIGSGQGLTINEIITLITNLTGENVNIVHMEKQKYDVEHFVLDTCKIKNVIGNHPITSIKKGIVETWNWINTIG